MELKEEVSESPLYPVSVLPHATKISRWHPGPVLDRKQDDSREAAMLWTCCIVPIVFILTARFRKLRKEACRLLFLIFSCFSFRAMRL